MALCGIKFFYEHTLQHQWATFDLVRPPKSRKLPVVLTQTEVRQVLGCVRRLPYRVCLTTIYSCGLRLGEALRLEVGDVDGERELLHIRQAKGARDRYVPLPQPTLLLQRQQWASHRHATLLFPSRFRCLPSQATHPSTTLRTSLLEAGVNLRLIQLWLGHKSLKTTALYTHLTRHAETLPGEKINSLMADLATLLVDAPW